MRKENFEMGFVKEALIDEPRFVPQLWDEMRDSIGNAVAEFNEIGGHRSDASIDTLPLETATLGASIADA